MKPRKLSKISKKCIGYIGLGKMGLNMVYNLIDKGWSVVAYNRSHAPRRSARRAGAQTVGSISDLVSTLPAPRLVWIMVSHQAVDPVLDELVPLLDSGDTIIEGGNSFFGLSVKRARRIEKKGINFLDVGVSGGPKGARNGACCMIGGKRAQYQKYERLFKDISVKDGYGYMGKSGSGHFVKMVHNGIEYGMMQAIAEGFGLMRKTSQFNLNFKEIVRVYNHGSVVESSLTKWLEDGFKKYGVDLKKISGKVSHSGEGLWTVETAKKKKFPLSIIHGSLNFRIKSQKNPSYTGQILSVMRNQFGHHEVKK